MICVGLVRHLPGTLLMINVTYLAFCADANMSNDRGVGSAVQAIGFVWFFDAEVGENVLAEDGAGVQVRSHETTVTGNRLKINDSNKI